MNGGGDVRAPSGGVAVKPVTDRDTSGPPAPDHAAPAGSSSRLFLGVMIALYGAATLVIFRACIQVTRGAWVYPTDDEYIGMAMAKNFALHGVWGITRHAFTSATSTPFYTLLTATVFRVVGVRDWIPLMLAGLAGAAALVVAERILRPCVPALRAGALAAVCFLPVLPVLVLLGMEHTLQIALVLLFVHLTVKLWDDPAPRLDWKLALVVILMVGTRYEGLFLIAAAAIGFAWRRRWGFAVALVAAGAFPVIAYAIISVLQGWYWLPASVAIKGAHMEMSRKAVVAVFYRFLMNLWIARELLGLIAALVVVAGYRYRRLPGALRYLFWLTLLPWLMHMATAQAGSTYRYEAYLIAMAVIAVALVMNEYRGAREAEKAIAALVVLIAIVPLAMRYAGAASNLPRASHAVFEQQYQMSEFLHRYYSGAAVAANDVGAINFRADLDCVDIAGLGNNALFHQWYAQKPILPVVEEESAKHHVRIAVIYDVWFPVLPQGWVRAGSWKIADRANLGSDVVSFYAVDPAELPRLKNSLIEFAASMPRDEQVFID